MNKLTKLLFSAISSVAIATSAFAGEFSVTGGVKATYTILSNTGTTGTHAIGKGLGISNEFSLTASGELDNGMTWSYAQDIDGATVQDDANIAFGTDYGTFKICITECGSSTKYAFDNSAYGIGSDKVMDTVLQQQTRCSTVKTLTRTTTFSSTLQQTYYH